jgi:hypothetical protein
VYSPSPAPALLSLPSLRHTQLSSWCRDRCLGVHLSVTHSSWCRDRCLGVHLSVTHSSWCRDRCLGVFLPATEGWSPEFCFLCLLNFLTLSEFCIIHPSPTHLPGS